MRVCISEIEDCHLLNIVPILAVQKSTKHVAPILQVLEQGVVLKGCGDISDFESKAKKALSSAATAVSEPRSRSLQQPLIK